MLLSASGWRDLGAEFRSVQDDIAEPSRGLNLLGKDLLSAACRLVCRLIPCPFSMSFGIGDFEGHGEGVVGGAD